MPNKAINIKIDDEGVPYVPACMHNVGKAVWKITWRLHSDYEPDYKLVDITGLPGPTFTKLAPAPDTMVFSDDNKGKGSHPKVYVYGIVVEQRSDSQRTLGKAIIRNDPG